MHAGDTVLDAFNMHELNACNSYCLKYVQYAYNLTECM